MLYPVSGGNFSFNTTYCTSFTNFSLKGADFDSLQETNSINYNFTSPITNVGNLVACNAVSAFITYKIDNLPVKTYLTNINCTTINATQTPLTFQIKRLSDDLTHLELIISSSNQSIGTFDTNTYSIYSPDFGFDSTTTNNVLFSLSSFGAVGQFVDLTFNGNYNDSSGVQHTINGIAHVLRSN